jgi:hypothetical protein
MKRSTFTIALALLSGICFSQESGKRVGINTTTPEATLHVNGDMIIEKAEIGLVTDTILVIRKGRIYKVPASHYQYTPPTNCPLLITGQGQSTGYYLKFQSAVPITSPNATLVIQGKTFQPAGTWVQGNQYFYSYTNTSGSPLNINQPFTVNFAGQQCNY